MGTPAIPVNSVPMTAVGSTCNFRVVHLNPLKSSVRSAVRDAVTIPLEPQAISVVIKIEVVPASQMVGLADMPERS